MYPNTQQQQELWNQLMTLCESSECFFYADQERFGQWFRIFNYRLASYTDFLQPGALECRGTMFVIDREGKNAEPLGLVSRPMQKFFNHRENPFTMDITLDDVETVWDKADGSLISSYMSHEDEVCLKSKGSLHSDQAQAAEKLLCTESYNDLYQAVRKLEWENYTVNMEYVAPDNRIVIGYEEPALIVLNARHRFTGEYMEWETLANSIRADRLVKRYEFDSHEEQVAFLENLPSMTGIEGVVVETFNGEFMKMKTEAYLTAHRAKDSINSPRRLFEAVLEEATDDLRTLFFDDPVALNMIEEMELKVDQIYNHAVDQVERFYERNKHLERKEYAILGQQEFTGQLRRGFGLAMSKYLGHEVNYKEFLRKHYKEFGIKDDPEPTGDE
jgi:RNA ligase